MSDITKIKEQRSKDDGDWDEWPYPTVTITSLVTGDLRTAILAKLNMPPDALGVITIEESQVSGGYSEYTQEDDCAIRVMIDGRERWKHESAFSMKSAMAAFIKWTTLAKETSNATDA
jgi:hypothetical protein